MIEVFTQRGMIRTVAARWHAQYANYKRTNPDWPLFGVGDKLDALNLDTATREEVDAIIGNSSWTSLNCNSCGRRDLDVVVQIGEVPDYESATALVCPECLGKATDLLASALATRERVA